MSATPEVRTPTTEEIRYAYAYEASKDRTNDAWADQFDRWLAEHDAEVAEKARADEREIGHAMHLAYRPEVVAEVAVSVHEECDWDRIAAWCDGKADSGPDGTDSGEWHSWIDVPGVGPAFAGMWIVKRHDGTFALRYEVAEPSDPPTVSPLVSPHPTPADETARDLRLLALDLEDMRERGHAVGTSMVTRVRAIRDAAEAALAASSADADTAEVDALATAWEVGYNRGRDQHCNYGTEYCHLSAENPYRATPSPVAATSEETSRG